MSNLKTFNRKLTIENIYLSTPLATRLNDCLSRGVMTNFLFEGSVGSGKSSLVQIIRDNRRHDCIEINVKEPYTKKSIRELLTRFASTVSLFDQTKCVLIDNVDEFSVPLQYSIAEAARDINFNAALVMTTRSFDSVIPELKMFCELQDIESNNYSVDDISQMHFERLKRMEVEKIQSLDKDSVAKIVTQFYPNFHSINAHLDRYVV
jgi:hypothetical protein